MLKILFSPFDSTKGCLKKNFVGNDAQKGFFATFFATFLLFNICYCFFYYQPFWLLIFKYLFLVKSCTSLKKTNKITNKISTGARQVYKRDLLQKPLKRISKPQKKLLQYFSEKCVFLLIHTYIIFYP